jgi:phosphoribosylamine--glycine ligase
MIAEPLTPILWAAATGMLRSAQVTVSPDPHVGVVLAAAGYPGEVRTGQRIEGVDAVDDALVFFAGVRNHDGALMTSGGRVMTIVGKGATFEQAMDKAYAAVSRVRFEGMQYRNDIGRKAVPT